MQITQNNSARFEGAAALNVAKSEGVVENRKVAQAVRNVNQNEYAGTGRELTFSIDPQTHQSVIRVVDSNTRTVLGQVPSEDVLRLAQYYHRTHASGSTQNQDQSSR